VIGIGEDVEDITKEIDHVLLEELVRNLRRGASKVVDQVKCDYLLAISLYSLDCEHTAETEIGDISHSVLNSPKDGIIDKLELRRR
jgi:hypothetical protein